MRAEVGVEPYLLVSFPQTSSLTYTSQSRHAESVHFPHPHYQANYQAQAPWSRDAGYRKGQGEAQSSVTTCKSSHKLHHIDQRIFFPLYPSSSGSLLHNSSTTVSQIPTPIPALSQSQSIYKAEALRTEGRLRNPRPDPRPSPPYHLRLVSQSFEFSFQP